MIEIEHMNRQLFLAGVPASGKSWLGSWLGECGYIHIDAERDAGADFDRAGIHREWDDLIGSGRAAVFVARIKTLTKPVVVNWGFPLCYLYIVPALQAEGVHTWWLHAGRDPALKAFVEREQKKPPSDRIPIECFDKQMTEIERQWPLISAAFGNQIIQGLGPDGSQRTPQELWSEMDQAG